MQALGKLGLSFSSPSPSQKKWGRRRMGRGRERQGEFPLLSHLHKGPSLTQQHSHFPFLTVCQEFLCGQYDAHFFSSHPCRFETICQSFPVTANRGICGHKPPGSLPPLPARSQLRGMLSVLIKVFPHRVFLRLCTQLSEGPKPLSPQSLHLQWHRRGPTCYRTDPGRG